MLLSRVGPTGGVTGAGCSWDLDGGRCPHADEAVDSAAPEKSQVTVGHIPAGSDPRACHRVSQDGPQEVGWFHTGTVTRMKENVVAF